MNAIQKIVLAITPTIIVAANAHAGRWLSRDPIQEGAGFVQRDPNPYAFVINNPNAETDALGLWPSSHHVLGAALGLNTPLTHQQSIVRAILGLSSHDYDILKAATVEVDESQGTADSYQHAMSDGLANQPVSDAKNAANRFVTAHIKAARLLLCRCTPDRDEALHQFGLALHTIQDATSPAHTGFQPWYGEKGHLKEAIAHVRKEDYDPGSGSHLDNATAWFWTFFSCPPNAPQLPQDFFGSLGADPPAPSQDSPDYPPYFPP